MSQIADNVRQTPDARHNTFNNPYPPRFGLWLLYACAARFRSVLRRPLGAWMRFFVFVFYFISFLTNSNNRSAYNFSNLTIINFVLHNYFDMFFRPAHIFINSKNSCFCIVVFALVITITQRLLFIFKVFDRVWHGISFFAARCRVLGRRKL